MKRIAIVAMGLLAALSLGGQANAQSGTNQDLSGVVSGQFSQAGLQQALSTVNDTQRDAIVQSLQSVINQLQSQPRSVAAPVAAAPVAAAPMYQAPAYQAPAYSAPVAMAPAAPVYTAPVQGPPLPPIQLPPVQLPAIDLSLIHI